MRGAIGVEGISPAEGTPAAGVRCPESRIHKVGGILEMNHHALARLGMALCLAVTLFAAIMSGSVVVSAQTWTHLRTDNWEVWYLDSNERLRYNYDNGQWWDIGEYGDWQTLSATGLTSDFIGDGSLHDLGNGFSIAYDSSLDLAFFKDGDYWRFFYAYEVGQWYSIGWGTGGAYGGWCTLSASGHSAEFVGWSGWHSLGTGWDFSYDAALDIGYYRGHYRTGAGERFAYEYMVGAWMQHGPSGGWSEFSAGGMSAQFIADGTFHSLNNGWTFAYNESFDHAYWQTGTDSRFAYDYGLGQWWHMGPVGSWSALGASDLAADFIGDGAFHSLNNGWTYAYHTSLNDGYWKTGTDLRFAYDYDAGRWWHMGPVGSWSALGASNLAADFIADGNFHSLNDGWIYAYHTSLNDGYWITGTGLRFAYDYDAGQWWHMGLVGGWFALGASNLAADFIGDGAFHSLNDGWTYAYHTSLHDGYWKTGTDLRFAYDYDLGQWYHMGPVGSWSELGASDVAADFIGDGAFHSLNNGWTYAYHTSLHDGYWKTGTDLRFAYDYDPGQWFHKGNSTDWGALSPESYSAEFVGDGQWHDVGNGFTYQYLMFRKEGYFKVGADLRFAYDYDPGQWFHKGNTTDWIALTGDNYWAQFIGNGAWYDLGNGWSYSYVSAGDSGCFETGGTARFSYSYEPSQWYHKGDTTDWGALSAAGVSAGFVGDGEWHDVGYGFTYQYVAADKEGYFKAGDLERFYYTYGDSQWLHKGDTTDWGALSAAGVSAGFVGDGNWHDVGNGFTYQYLMDHKKGYFKFGAAERFYYTYGPSQWYHKGNTTDWAALSVENYSAQFVGDGHWYNLGNGLYYSYLNPSDYGVFTAHTNSAAGFAYSYTPGQWLHQSYMGSGGWVALTADNHSIGFIGDGQWHDLGFGNGWAYQYDEADEEGYFKKDGYERFYYDYELAQWWHIGETTDWGNLSGAGASAAFVGDGAWHDLANGFTYQYLSAGDEAYFKLGGQYRFHFTYGPSRWYHTGNWFGWAALSEEVWSTSFVGDGAWHDLGTGFNYQYVADGDEAHYNDGYEGRFYYDYVAGQWYHTTSHCGWVLLSGTGLTAQFIGDGHWYNLGLSNLWWYYYDLSTQYGYWSRNADPDDNSNQRFSYSYTTGLWQHQGNYGDFNPLGSEGWWDATFLGDGNNHWVNGDRNYQYHYDYNLERGYWDGQVGRLSWQYYYDVGEWWRYDSEKGWILTNGPGAGTDCQNPQ